MSNILKNRLTRLAAATLAAVTLSPLAAHVSPASAAVSPAIDRSFAAPTPNADPDPFYTPPSPLPTGNPGDIIRARPSLAGPPTARSLANAWQVMYLSTDANGQPDEVTGTILVPKGRDLSTTPIVAFAPGTTGPAFRCTVSRFINSGAFYEQPGVNDMLKAGYAVAITDYEGYHPNPTTTYVVNSMGNAVLDVVRAAERLPEAGLSPTAKVLVRGFSQGGGAAMWAGELQPTYAPDLNLIGVAGGGVPANLNLVLVGLQKSAAFGFAIDALEGLDHAYPELNLNSFLTDSAKPVFANSNENDCTLELLTAYSGKTTNDYVTSPPFLQDNWLARVAQNELGLLPIKVPVFQYHATNDPIVKYTQAKTLHDEYCKLGVNVLWKTFDTGHITTVARGNADVASFIADRLAGKTQVSNCDTTTG